MRYFAWRIFSGFPLLLFPDISLLALLLCFDQQLLCLAVRHGFDRVRNGVEQDMIQLLIVRHKSILQKQKVRSLK